VKITDHINVWRGDHDLLNAKKQRARVCLADAAVVSADNHFQQSVAACGCQSGQQVLAASRKAWMDLSQA
jgi:hypothetical protein